MCIYELVPNRILERSCHAVRLAVNRMQRSLTLYTSVFKTVTIAGDSANQLQSSLLCNENTASLQHSVIGAY